MYTIYIASFNSLGLGHPKERILKSGQAPKG